MCASSCENLTKSEVIMIAFQQKWCCLSVTWRRVSLSLRRVSVMWRPVSVTWCVYMAWCRVSVTWCRVSVTWCRVSVTWCRVYATWRDVVCLWRDVACLLCDIMYLWRVPRFRDGVCDGCATSLDIVLLSVLPHYSCWMDMYYLCICTFNIVIKQTFTQQNNISVTHVIK